jgi:hypothetical protein
MNGKEFPKVKIMLNVEKLEVFPPRSRIKQECPLSPLFIILDILANAIRQEKEISHTG